MKVFISWSGDHSKEVADALRKWLPNVLHAVNPFVSSQDIRAGTRWSKEIADELETTSFGLICVTSENQKAPWLNFEAGALAKSVAEGRVIPLAIDLSITDIEKPLADFQAKLPTREGIGDVVVSMNECCDLRIDGDRLENAIEKWWPDLQEELAEIEEKNRSGNDSTPKEPARTERELIEEILTTVRSVSRSSAKPSDPLSTESILATVHATADKDEKAEIVKPLLLKRIAELRDAGQTNLRWGKLISPFPSGGGVHNALTKAFRELRQSGEISCTIDPEPGPNQGFGGKDIRLDP